MSQLSNNKEEATFENSDFSKTQGFRKIWNLFIAISKTDTFNDKIFEIRSFYGIPKNGFNSYKEKKAWDDLDTDKKDRLKLNLEISGEIKKICNKFGFNFLCSEEMIENYLFYNEKVFNFINSAPYDLCYIKDLKEKKTSFDLNIIDEIDVYPISIGISPYASRRDIEDFIRKIYKYEIKPLQEKYKVADSKVGKVKSKNKSVQERNSFIYENRNFPRKKIKELVKDKFGVTLDYEYVGKIISDEKKKRKEL